MIVCDPAMPNDFCVPAACPTNTKLLDSANPDASWIFAKLGMTPTGCGDQMPLAPGNAADRWTAERQACLQTFFRALAALGPAPGTGGSSGASTGGSAGSATGGSAGTTGGGGNGGVATGGAGASSGGSAGSITAGSGGASAGSGGASAGSGGQGGANGGVAGSL